jgi:hypothetical protein
VWSTSAASYSSVAGVSAFFGLLNVAGLPTSSASCRRFSSKIALAQRSGVILGRHCQQQFQDVVGHRVSVSLLPVAGVILVSNTCATGESHLKRYK